MTQVASSVASVQQPTLRVHLLQERAILPRYQTAGAAGMDLACCLPEAGSRLEIAPGQIVLVPTGLRIAVPLGYEAQIRPRSGLSTKHGITLPNSPGTIDSDYRGELFVPLVNLSHSTFILTDGMRIAQMVIAPVVQVTIEPVATLDETQRGSGGFGSTGH